MPCVIRAKLLEGFFFDYVGALFLHVYIYVNTVVNLYHSTFHSLWAFHTYIEVVASYINLNFYF